ncbi:protein ENHANCED DISEASE RESISTANCE 2-like [Lycium ferocissimum]|uniref:protein ENHANCED DISEASE RESISTANCE 2-like n=1 Tax=Lycium ferocissimum TaxID=112874 RepID=UPI002816515C|nr:protein ENHANCED DISEASE RESISTANCE 2-like [Lycium ferocissimum]
MRGKNDEDDDDQDQDKKTLVLDPVNIDPSQIQGSLRKGDGDKDSNCWNSPWWHGVYDQGKTYLKDNAKVMGGQPLLTLVSVDWLKVDKAVDNIALHPKCLVQVPAKPNYCLVMYYAADRPVSESSSLGKFVNGSDSYRDSRFKLIPSIVQGYWMVKRAVGTKACLLGKREETELPEYILGTVARLNRNRALNRPFRLSIISVVVSHRLPSSPIRCRLCIVSDLSSSQSIVVSAYRLCIISNPLSPPHRLRYVVSPIVSDLSSSQICRHLRSDQCIIISCSNPSSSLLDSSLELFWNI